MRMSFLPCAPCESNSRIESFLKIAVVGAGDVVKNRIAPALNVLANRLGGLQIAICSLEPTSPIYNLQHRYYQALPCNLLPLDDLHADGFLDNQTLWIVATPPQTHVPIVFQLDGMCGRVAIEKPLATNARYARVLSPRAILNHRSLYPLDHKLFTAGSLSFLNECQANPLWLSRVRHVEGVFFESCAFPPGRAQEDGIFDIQWHLFVLMVAAFKTLGQSFEIGVDLARIARHGSDPSGVFSDATVSTASQLSGSVISHELHASFEFVQAKAAPRNEKHVRFFDAQNNILAHVDLSESGWQAHGRMLEALIAPVVDMRHTLADAIALTELLGGVSESAEECPAYLFGSLPSFMRRGHMRGSARPQRPLLRCQE